MSICLSDACIIEAFNILQNDKSIAFIVIENAMEAMEVNTSLLMTCKLKLPSPSFYLIFKVSERRQISDSNSFATCYTGA